MFESKKVKALRTALASEQHAHDLILANYREQLYAEQEITEDLANEISQLRAQVYRLMENA